MAEPTDPREYAEDLIKRLAADAGAAKDTLVGALAALCPGGADHEFAQHRDRKPPWCPHCRYTEWGVKV